MGSLLCTSILTIGSPLVYCDTFYWCGTFVFPRDDKNYSGVLVVLCIHRRAAMHLPDDVNVNDVL